MFRFIVLFIFTVERIDRKQMVWFKCTVIKSFIALVTLVGSGVIEICKLYGGLYADLMQWLFVKTSIELLKCRLYGCGGVPYAIGSSIKYFIGTIDFPWDRK